MQSEKTSGVDIEQLLQSNEFYEKVRSDIGRKILFEVQLHDPMQIDYVCNDDDFSLILKHIENVWMQLGATEPHWSVVSTADFKATKIRENIDRFNESGRAEVNNLKRLLKRVGVDASHVRTAVEYGCGVGRVTRWLATLFPNVIGIDVSESHLGLAREYFSQEGVGNVITKKISSLDEIKSLPTYEFLYSKIVLQHNPPPVIHKILDTLSAQLAEGGIGVVQIPTYARNYRFSVAEYINSMGKISNMEMHVLPQPAIFDIFRKHGCIPREVSRDHLVRTVDFVSTTFVFVKNSV